MLSAHLSANWVGETATAFACSNMFGRSLALHCAMLSTSAVRFVHLCTCVHVPVYLCKATAAAPLKCH